MADKTTQTAALADFGEAIAGLLAAVVDEVPDENKLLLAEALAGAQENLYLVVGAYPLTITCYLRLPDPHPAAELFSIHADLPSEAAH